MRNTIVLLVVPDVSKKQTNVEMSRNTNPKLQLELVSYKGNMLAHGATQVKLINAQQASTTHNHRNLKENALRNNASIWFNSSASTDN